MEKNKVEIVKFLGEEVRIVNDDYIVLKDMFSALGRVKKDGTWTNEKNKLMSFLEDADKKGSHSVLGVSSNNVILNSARKSYNVECLKLSTAYLSMVVFRPTKKAKKYDVKLEMWRKFINFLDEIIEKDHKEEIEDILIIRDEDKQKSNIKQSMRLNMSPREVNNIINKIMAKIVKRGKYITKGDLRKLNNESDVDLMYIRDKTHKRFNKLIKQAIDIKDDLYVDEETIIDEAIESCKTHAKELYKKEEQRVKESNVEEERFILHLRRKK